MHDFFSPVFLSPFYLSLNTALFICCIFWISISNFIYIILVYFSSVSVILIMLYCMGLFLVTLTKLFAVFFCFGLWIPSIKVKSHVGKTTETCFSLGLSAHLEQCWFSCTLCTEVGKWHCLMVILKFCHTL